MQFFDFPLQLGNTPMVNQAASVECGQGDSGQAKKKNWHLEGIFNQLYLTSSHDFIPRSSSRQEGTLLSMLTNE